MSETITHSYSHPQSHSISCSHTPTWSLALLFSLTHSYPALFYSCCTVLYAMTKRCNHTNFCTTHDSGERRDSTLLRARLRKIEPMSETCIMGSVSLTHTAIASSGHPPPICSSWPIMSSSNNLIHAIPDPSFERPYPISHGQGRRPQAFPAN